MIEFQPVLRTDSIEGETAISCTQNKILENIVPDAKGHRTVRAFAALGPSQALQPGSTTQDRWELTMSS